ncbi:MAG TPA: hypothetical protein VIO58_15245, partial [Candidatus Methanoperedens sp.]
MNNTKIEAKEKVKVEPTDIRSLEIMKHDMRRKRPDFPHLKLESGEQPLEEFKVAPQLKHKLRKQFMPTMPGAKYAKLKASLRAKKPSAKLKIAQPLAPAILIEEFEGATDVDAVMPPDTHGAAGLQEFVETTNMHIDIYQKADPTQRTSISLAAFFGYFAQALFDARVIYDTEWNRWVITADAFPESPDVQYHFIAVSMTPSALDSFFIYAVNVTFNSGDFWDYPQLGMDQDSIIITANIFSAAGNFNGADMFAIAKAQLYNGWGFWVPVFTGLEATLAPPIVLDQNANTFLIAAP